MTGADRERPAPPYPIASVDRTLSLIQMLAESPEVKLSEVRARLDVGQSTAHRLLAMFVYRGFAVQDPRTRSYRAGPYLLDLRRDTGVRFDVAREIRPTLARLAGESGETAHFAVLDGTDVRYIDVVESTRALRVSGRRGRTMPARDTSIGRAMLAAEGDAWVSARYGAPAQPGDQDAAGHDTLLRELARTRSRGYARNRGEVELGVCSVGVAVVDPAGDLLGGLSIAAPDSRWSPALEKAHVQLLHAAAARLAGRE
ncbi:IclR family transcriptional regulator [Nonomuraea fuscirosea]|uniref:IclR family transcriptional regulator n=1 Tax=Nonomuraea fuscirosea TaxID=1291556 RepID=UPI0034271BC3